MNDLDRKNGTPTSPLRLAIHIRPRVWLPTIHRQRHNGTVPVRLQGRALLLARAAWLAVAALTCALYVASTWTWLGQVRGLCPPGVCVHGQVPPAATRALADLHLSVGFYGWYTLGLNVLFAVGFAAVAALLFWRRSHDPLALYISLTLLLFGTISFHTGPIARLVATSPSWRLPVEILQFLGAAAFGILGYVFPDGRFVPRWTRLAAVAFALWFLPSYLFPGSALDFAIWPGVAFFSGWALFLGAVGAAQIYRYRRISTPAQRLQTKWVVFGILAAGMGYLCGQLAIRLAPAPTSPGAVLVNLSSPTLINAGLLLLPLSIGIAILRYHLFDIDLIIRQTLIYTALVATLALLYEGVALVLQQVLLTLTGQVNLPAEVAVAFGVGALAEPLHSRIERDITRVFYSRKYEAERRIEAFSKQVRRELGLTTMPERLEEVVESRLGHVRVEYVEPRAHDEHTEWPALATPASQYGTPPHPIPPPSP